MLEVGPTGLVDPEVYRSQAFCAAELDHVFPASWIFVARERWLPEPGRRRVLTGFAS